MADVEENLQQHSLKADISGGITAGIIALPLALAFGIASGLGASAGLWGAIVLGFFAALFGGTKMQVSGPTGPMSVVSAAIVVHFAGDIGSIMAVFALTGLVQIAFGILGLGKLVRYIPYSVISGFMTGVGFIIIILQLNPMLGSAGVGNTVAAVMAVPSALANINIMALAFAAATLAIVYLTPARLVKIIPPPLLAIMILTPLCAVLNSPVATIGAIPTGFASIAVPVPNGEHFFSILMYAVMLAILGSIDSLLTSLVADSITKTKHNSNRELIGQGIGNALTGFVGGIPGAGATMRTVANIKAGGMGRVSGMTHSLFLLFVVLIFAPVVGYVPLPVLAGILVKVGVDILDYRLLKRLTHIPRQDLAVMLVVFLLTVFVDLIFAVGVGVAVAWLCYRLGVSEQHRHSAITIINDDENTKLVEVTGPMFFANNARVMQQLSLDKHPSELTIDCTQVTFMDISAIYALQDFIDTVDQRVTKINIKVDGDLMTGRALMELEYVLPDNVDDIGTHN